MCRGNGGKSRIPERNWISTDGTNGARTRAIGLVRSMETVIVVCRSHMCCMTKGNSHKGGCTVELEVRIGFCEWSWAWYWRQITEGGVSEGSE